MIQKDDIILWDGTCGLIVAKVISALSHILVLNDEKGTLWIANRNDCEFIIRNDYEKKAR